MKRKNKLVGAFIALSFTGSLHAATITAVGSVLDNSGSQVSQWRTSTTLKTMDLDGDNIYGTFGGIAFGDAVVGAMGFISSQNQVGPYAGYSTIDDINGGVDRQVRTTTNNAVAGTNQVMYTFVVNAPVLFNQTMRVGIGLDGLNGTITAPATIGLKELGGGGGLAEVSITPANNLMDMYFFDVRGGVSAGTQFQVFADSGSGNYVTHQFVTLDVVPEPSSVALLALGGLALIVRRRK